jgi:hypothetical protein
MGAAGAAWIAWADWTIAREPRTARAARSLAIRADYPTFPQVAPFLTSFIALGLTPYRLAKATFVSSDSRIFLTF